MDNDNSKQEVNYENNTSDLEGSKLEKTFTPLFKPTKVYTAINIGVPKDYKVTLLDWDDSLIARKKLYIKTAPYLNENIINAYQELLSETQQEILNLFATLETYVDKIFIVSNSPLEWVNFSMEILLPKLKELCHNSNKIAIISAVELYEQKHPKKCSKEETLMHWKPYAFESIVKTEIPGLYNYATTKQIISIGDSPHHDEHAIRYIDNLLLPNTCVKFYKFKENPSLQEIKEQIMEFHKVFTGLIKNNTSQFLCTTAEFKHQTKLLHDNNASMLIPITSNNKL